MARRREWPVCAAGALLPALILLSSARAGGPPAARWVAADAVIYLEATRPAQLLGRLTSAPVLKLLDANPDYRQTLQGQQFQDLLAVTDKVAGSIGLTRDEALRALTDGGMVLAVEADAGTPPRAFLVVTPRDPSVLARANDALLALARADAAGKGRPDPVQSVEYRGVTGYAVAKGAYAIVEGTLVIAGRPDTLKSIIDRARDGLKPGPSIADDADWSARRGRMTPGAIAWGFARLDRLRTLDPAKFVPAEKDRAKRTLLFGAWADALARSPWVAADLSWTEDRLAVALDLPEPPDGFADGLEGFFPPKGSGAPGLIRPPGTIASVSLWRDLAAVWEARSDLFTPEEVQGLNKLDGVAGTFFGGRDFGQDVLGAFGTRWRLVVALQDYQKLDPAPDVKLPAFALIAELKRGDDDFGRRLKVAFQSIIGLTNLNAAQQKAPPLELGSETVDGITIATARYMPPRTPPDPKEPVHRRQNFSPAAAVVGETFILSSSVGLVRDLIPALKAPASGEAATLVGEADGAALAALIGRNRERLVMQDMLDKGHDRARAESDVGALVALARYLGHARLTIEDRPDAVRVGLEFAPGK